MLKTLLKLIKARFIVPEELTFRDILVWDTSSLSHGFEEFSHAVMSAYMEMKPPKTWSRLKERIGRRFKSENMARNILLQCDTMKCLIPSSIFRELSKDPYFKDSLNALTDKYVLERKYMRRISGRGTPLGFSYVFKPSLIVDEPRKDLVDYVKAVASRMGYRISHQDAEGIALAMQNNAVLVTADKNQAKLADKLGLRVLYTIG